MDRRSILFPFVLALATAGCGLAKVADPPQAAEPSSTAGAPSGALVAVTAPLPDQEATPALAAQPTFDSKGLIVGPGRGFVALDEPRVVRASQASWLDEQAMVLGVVWNGQARAYPISQMAYHHIANDRIGGQPYLVTY
jgi:hypothetical protein